LVYTDISASTGEMHVGILDVASGSMEALLTGPYNVAWPVLSPDGHRIAYVSDESGRTEVWVRPFQSPGPATQVSTEGGYEAVWSPDGNELFFRRGASFFAVALEGADGLRPGSPREMFSGRYDLSPTGHQHYDVDSTGRRFAAVALGTKEPSAFQLVVDWDEDLARLVPGRH
jgi:serine/threonine-protein kinase